MAYIDSINRGELSELKEAILADNDIFEIGKKRAAKIFLVKLLKMKGSATYDELESAYRADAPDEEIPQSSVSFWTYIEKKFLGLEKEPKEKFTEISFSVSKDLEIISENIVYLDKELTRLEKKKADATRLLPEERYYRNQLEYFKGKNLKAKDEIVEFMAYKARTHAIAEASVPPSGFKASIQGITSMFGKRNPYPFGNRLSAVLPDPYDVNGLDSLSNKFTDLIVSHYLDVVGEIRAKPDKFGKFASKYIKGFEYIPSASSKLSSLVKQSHILASRKNIIKVMLKHYKNRDYVSFVSMAPLQIEGIFADVCREIGISENQLDISSLNEKLKHIDGKIDNFFYFEYYSFKFPILRNLVAHGGLIDGDLEETAINLLLDLLPVCELTVSKDLPINNALEVLDNAHKGKNESIVKWFMISDDVKIPDFYKVKKKIAQVEALYTSQRFWDYLQNELEQIKDVKAVKDSMPVKIARKLKTKKIAESIATDFLKKSEQSVIAAIEKRKVRYANFFAKFGLGVNL